MRGPEASYIAFIHEYAQHDSWRCDHPDRYSQEENCPCGLLRALEDIGIDPGPWRRVTDVSGTEGIGQPKDCRGPLTM